MFVEPANWPDAEKYFAGCFVKVKEYDDTIVYLDKVTNEGIFGTDENNNNIMIEFDGATTGKVGYTLDYILPKKSYFQYGPYAALLYRIPARMWKKGINKQNTELVRLENSFNKMPLGFDELKAYVRKPVHQSYTTYKDNESTALSPRLAITFMGDIFIDKTKIGKLIDNQVIVRKLFLDECKTVFPGCRVSGV